MNRIHVVVLVSVLCVTACNDRAASGIASKNAVADAQPADDFLPKPTGPLKIAGEDPQTNHGLTTLEEMIREMERITPVKFVVTQESRAVLGRIPVGNMSTIVAPPEKAWNVFESILCENEFLLAFLSRTDPIVLTITSTMPQAGRGAGSAKGHVVEVPVADLPRWRAHPAFLITTSVELGSVNVRDLSNSMRQMFTDPGSQQIVPMGNSNTLLITGLSGSVIPLVNMLQGIDAAERKRQEERAKVEQAQPGKPEKAAAPK